MTNTAREESIPEIIAEFSHLFAAARTNFARNAEEVHPEIRGIGMMMLQIIMRKGPITAKSLGALLNMDKATVSRQLAQLRALGLVEAEPATEDRRSLLLTASADARATLDEVHRRGAHDYRVRFEDWNDEDLAQLLHLLRRFNASAELLTDPSRRANP